MTILPFTQQDIPNLSPLQPPDWGDIAPFFNYFIHSPYCAPIKVVENDTLIGVGVSLKHFDTVWLAQIIVHPEHRNKGLGRMITEYLINSIDKNHFQTIYLIATPLGEPVYTKIGFETETEYTFYKGEVKPFEISPNIYPLEEKHIQEVYALDEYAYGENRQNRLCENLEGGKVFITGNKVEGYYLPSLVEGPITATNKTAGTELMKLRLQTGIVSIIPVDNPAANDFLLQNGYTAIRTAKRMRLGKKRETHLEQVYNRVSGQIG